MLIAPIAAMFALCFALSAPATAVAAVAAGGPLDVQVWPQDGQTIVISSVELPASTSLPAVVRIPVVPGSTVEWAGEILGSNSSADVEVPFKLVDGQGGQYAEFTLTKSRRGQIDSVAAPLTVSGTVVSTRVDWVQSVTAVETIFSVRIPSAVSDVKIAPAPEGTPVTNELGEALYVLSAVTLDAGEKQVVDVSYNTVPPVEATSDPLSANTIVIALVAGLALAVIALVLVVRRRSAT